MFNKFKRNKADTLNVSKLPNYFEKGIPIISKTITEDINLHKLSKIANKTNLHISFENCFIQNIDISFHTFENRIKFKNCIIKDFMAMSIFYPQGFEMINCIILENFDLTCGGHNKLNSFVLENCVFNGKVDFIDCWFMGKVIIRKNIFTNGTNILGNSKFGTKVQFEDEYILENNLGAINLEH
ncbi:hypothetical protein ND860_18430 [Leptospira levettii]|nr:hypothetical protein [Leptospira levettii]MCW7467839.1 hypothetical protein [Leptospira levettii]MCW7498519.1 hypothetical protein [Leptospira levettii]MCW7513470.1 hypothetical protein [Leptospira levettii]